eukprot:4139316-Amphidinium_carterae.1
MVCHFGKVNGRGMETRKPHVPEELDLNGETWDAVGGNEVWRLAKYYPGDRFCGSLSYSLSLLAALFCSVRRTLISQMPCFTVFLGTPVSQVPYFTVFGEHQSLKCLFFRGFGRPSDAKVDLDLIWLGGHCDSWFERTEKEVSMLTVNIYMNGVTSKMNKPPPHK